MFLFARPAVQYHIIIENRIIILSREKLGESHEAAQTERDRKPTRTSK